MRHRPRNRRRFAAPLSEMEVRTLQVGARGGQAPERANRFGPNQPKLPAKPRLAGIVLIGRMDPHTDAPSIRARHWQ